MQRCRISRLQKTIVAVEITRVLVPGAILDLHKKLLASFGTVPFTVVCRKTQLQTMNVKVSPVMEGDFSVANMQIIGQLNMVQEDSESMLDEVGQHIQESWLADADSEETASPEVTKLSQDTMVDIENQQIGQDILDELSGNSASPIRS